MIRIPKTHKRFDALRLVIKARAKDATRFAIDTILATENQIVATDGKRMHYVDNKIVPSPDAERWLEPGQYEVIKDNQQEIMLIKIEPKLRWPAKWQDVIPKHTKYFDITTFAPEINFLIANQGIFVNFQYVGEIIGKAYGRVRVWFGDSNQPIKIDLNGVECVVMHCSYPDATFGEVKTREPQKEAV